MKDEDVRHESQVLRRLAVLVGFPRLTRFGEELRPVSVEPAHTGRDCSLTAVCGTMLARTLKRGSEEAASGTYPPPPQTPTPADSIRIDLPQAGQVGRGGPRIFGLHERVFVEARLSFALAERGVVERDGHVTELGHAPCVHARRLLLDREHRADHDDAGAALGGRSCGLEQQSGKPGLVYRIEEAHLGDLDRRRFPSLRESDSTRATWF